MEDLRVVLFLEQIERGRRGSERDRDGGARTTLDLLGKKYNKPFVKVH